MTTKTLILGQGWQRLNPWLKRPIVAALFLLAWGGLSGMIYVMWVHGADHRDFYPRWAGTRLALLERRDLYAADTEEEMQRMLYGAPLTSGDRQGFAYPAHLAVLLLPFALIPDVEVATALWAGLSVILALAALLVLRQTARGVPGWVVGLFLFWHYFVLTFFQGQVTVLPLLGLTLGYAAFERRNDFWAGVWLALGTVKPELVLLPSLGIVVGAVVQRRWRVLGGVCAAGLVLFAASVVLAGWWLPGWLQALQRYAGYAKVVWPLGFAWSYSPALGLGVTALAGFFFYAVRREPQALFAASIPLGMLLFSQTLMWGLIMLTIPLLLSWQGRARWGVIAAWFVGWGWVWVLFYHPDAWVFQSLLMPLLVLGVVAWSRWRPSSGNGITIDAGLRFRR